MALIVLLGLGSAGAAAETTGTVGNVVYVNIKSSSGKGDGSSWKKALRSIQDGIDAAPEGGQVWVANGTYHENLVIENDGLRLMGGFDGDEQYDWQRDVLDHRTVVVGDTDDSTSGTIVLRGAKDVIVDSLIVTGAMAYGAGGGITCLHAENAVVQRCLIQDNQTAFGAGAGFMAVDSSTALINCVVSGNRGGAQGGGVVYLDGGNHAVMNCTLRANSANGIVVGDSAKPVIVNTIITAHSGSGILQTTTTAAPRVLNCLLWENGRAATDGQGQGYRTVNEMTMGMAGATDNVAGDPLLDRGDDARLGQGSAAIDRGLLAAAPGYDIHGEARPGKDGKVDIGADETSSGWEPPRDEARPVSRVLALPSVTAGPTFSVAYAASDSQSGLERVRLYYRVNGGAWRQYGRSFTQSPIPFNRPASAGDGLYEFYTRAQDRAGLVESAPSGADARTLVLSAIKSGRFYVNAAACGTNTGETWRDAFPSLADALSAAATLRGAVDEIWVARGTYTPTSGSDRSRSFNLVPGVAVYGGFAGTETALSQRNLAANPTVLSGDLNGDDAGGLRTDNSRHVVNATNLTTGTALDGFTIRGGFADGSGDNAQGAGILLRAGRLDVRNCSIRENLTANRPSTGDTPSNAGAGGGAGMYITSGSQATLTRCIISDNRTGNGGWSNAGMGDGGSGGGILCRRSTLTLTESTVTRNATGTGGMRFLTSWPAVPPVGHGGHGGGLCLESSTFTASGCTISTNTTNGRTGEDPFGDSYAAGHTGSGAGIFATDSSATLSDCVLNGNATGGGDDGRVAGSGGNGGAIWFISGSGSLRLTRCTLRGNATGDGGSARNAPGHGGLGGALGVGASAATLQQCMITSNSTGRGGLDLWEAKPAGGGSGGGIWCATSTLTLDRSALTRNRAGRGSDNYYSGGPGGSGGGLYCAASKGTLTNCIVHSNIAGNGGAGTSTPEDLHNVYPAAGGDGGSGGGLALDGSPLAIRLSTIANNTAGAGGNKSPAAHRIEGPDGQGGGIFVTGGAPALAGSILWGNRVFDGAGEAAQLSGSATLSYCDVQGWSGARGGTGNIGSDPQFANPLTPDLHLRAGSPCIDSGAAVPGVSVDYEGAARPYDGDGRGAGTTGDRSDTDMGGLEYRGVQTGPTLRAIVLADPDPTSKSQARFTVTFSEAVTGVDANDFSLAPGGIRSAAIQGVSGTGAVYTVTVSSGSGTGTLRLNLKDTGTGIVDRTRRPLRTGVIGPAYTIDRALPKVQITLPNEDLDPLPGITLSGAASDVGSGVRQVRVRLNGGPWRNAAGTTQWFAPLRLTIGRNHFEAQASDAAGNLSAVAAGDYDYSVPGIERRIRDYMLGRIPFDPAMDANSDGRIDVADLIKVLKLEFPIHPGPANGEANVSAFLFLNWDSVNAETCDLYLWKAAEPKPAKPYAAGLGEDAYETASPLAYRTAYKWQVVARRGSEALAGPVWSFTTMPGPVLVNLPRGGETWLAGKPVSVQWQADTSIAGTAFRIELWRAGVLVRKLGNDFSNTDSHDVLVTVPAGIPKAAGYRVRVTSIYMEQNGAGTASWDESDGTVTIQ